MSGLQRSKGWRRPSPEWKPRALSLASEGTRIAEDCVVQAMLFHLCSSRNRHSWQLGHPSLGEQGTPGRESMRRAWGKRAQLVNGVGGLWVRTMIPSRKRKWMQTVTQWIFIRSREEPVTFKVSHPALGGRRNCGNSSAGLPEASPNLLCSKCQTPTSPKPLHRPRC